MTFLSVVLILCACMAYSAPLELVENGVSKHIILVKPKALPATMAAAKDLQHYLELSTGARLPIIQAEETKNPAVKIGFLTVDTPEGFMVKTENGDLHISGDDTPGDPYGMNWWQPGHNTRTGTWSGVSDFLERQLGIRWIFPGELGEYVPKTKNLSIPELNYTDAPKMVWRSNEWLVNWKDMPKEDRVHIYHWIRRSRLGYSQLQRHTHAWGLHFNPEQLFDQNPDYFAMLNGIRSKVNLYSHEPAQMCTSNNEAVKAFAKIIIEKCRKRPAGMFEISPNDGGGFCECDKCTALDKISANGQRNMSNRIFDYGNRLVAEVKKELAGQKLGLYAYSYFVEPCDFTLDENISVGLVHNSMTYTYCNAKTREQHKKQLLEWRKRASELFFVTFPQGMGCLNTPCYSFRNLKFLFENLNAAKINAFAYCAGTGFGASGLNKYIVARYMWNPDCDINAVYEDALKCAFAEAAPLLKEYFAAVEDRLEVFFNGEKPGTNDVSMGSWRIFPGLYDVCFPGLAEEYLQKLRSAQTAAKDAGVKRRLEMVADVLEYTGLGVQLNIFSPKVLKVKQPLMADIAVAQKIVERRMALEERMHTLPDIVSLLGTYTREAMPNLTHELYNNLIVALTRRDAKAKWVELPENYTPDGKLAEDFWQDIMELKIDLLSHDSSKGEISAFAKIARSEKYLLIGVQCEEPRMDAVHDAIVTRNGPVWAENNIDIFIDPGSDGDKYFHIIANSLGTLFTSQVGKDKEPSWLPDIKIKAWRYEQGWSLEMAVPLDSLCHEMPEGGNIWGFNICRVRKMDGKIEYYCWSPTFGLFDKPERFGRLVVH